MTTVDRIRARIKRATDLRQAAELAAAGRVREARALLRSYVPVGAIEVDMTTVTRSLDIASKPSVHDRFDTSDARSGR